MRTITTAIALRSEYAKWELKKRFKFVGTRFPPGDRVENLEKSNCCRFALDWAINVWAAGVISGGRDVSCLTCC